MRARIESIGKQVNDAATPEFTWRQGNAMDDGERDRRIDGPVVAIWRFDEARERRKTFGIDRQARAAP